MRLQVLSLNLPLRYGNCVLDALLDTAFCLLCQSLLDNAEGNDVQVRGIAGLRRV